MENPSREPKILLLKDLKKEYYRLNFIVNKKDSSITKQMEISLKAGELVGKLYDVLLKQYINPYDKETLENLKILCVRLVFCLYDEDTGIFGQPSKFHDYLLKYKSTFRQDLIVLFKILDQLSEKRNSYLDDNLASFPYVNGGLFENEDIIIPKLNDEIIDIILNKTSAGFDWNNIGPTIFGSIFESTLNPESRRARGMYYTAIENIHKVINPLFLDKLNVELKSIICTKITNLSRVDSCRFVYNDWLI